METATRKKADTTERDELSGDHRPEMFFNFHIAHTVGLTEETRYFIEESSVDRSGQQCDCNRYPKEGAAQ